MRANFSSFILLHAAIMVGTTEAQNMVKMCLFYGSSSGHARSDPIINQNCASDHVHTFYGPQNFHPNTTYEDLLATLPQFSTTPFIENESLYWHPTIYQVLGNGNGRRFIRPPTETSPYYRWDNSVEPKTEAFPPGFRMIAHSSQPGANLGGETGSNMIVECCDMINGEESCTETGFFQLPTQKCDFVGIAMAMPTCWDGQSLGDDNDHTSHMAYTLDGTVAGRCPDGFPRRLPQVQLFVRVNNYQGGTYILADGMTDVWHVDFMNGWEEGKLQEIIDNCPVLQHDAGDYNPPCNCEEFLTPNTRASGALCESDVRTLILDEATDGMSVLPRGTCQGSATLIPKSWRATPPLNCTPIEDNGGSEGQGGESDEDDEEDEGEGEDESGDGEEDEDEDEGEGEGESEEGESGEDGEDDEDEGEAESEKGESGEDEEEEDGSVDSEEGESGEGEEEEEEGGSGDSEEGESGEEEEEEEESNEDEDECDSEDEECKEECDSDDEDCEDGEDDEETEGLVSISKQAKQAKTKRTVSGDGPKSTGFLNQQALLLCGNFLLVTAFLHWQ